jgi:predicted nucleic acid-binding protein
VIKIVKNTSARFKNPIQSIYKDDIIIGELVVGDLSKTVFIKLKTTHSIQTMSEIIAHTHRIAPMNYKVCIEYGELSAETKHDPYAFRW